MGKLLLFIFYGVLFLLNYIFYRNDDDNGNYLKSGLHLLCCIICISIIVWHISK